MEAGRNAADQHGERQIPHPETDVSDDQAKRGVKQEGPSPPKPRAIVADQQEEAGGPEMRFTQNCKKYEKYEWPPGGQNVYSGEVEKADPERCEDKKQIGGRCGDRALSLAGRGDSGYRHRVSLFGPHFPIWPAWYLRILARSPAICNLFP